MKEGKGLTDDEHAALFQRASTRTTDADHGEEALDDRTSPHKLAQLRPTPQQEQRRSLTPAPAFPKVLVIIAPLLKGASPDNHVLDLPLTAGQPTLAGLRTAALNLVQADTHNVQNLVVPIQRKPVRITDDQALRDHLNGIKSGHHLEVTVQPVAGAAAAKGQQKKVGAKRQLSDIDDVPAATDGTLGKTQGFGALRNRFRPTHKAAEVSLLDRLPAS